MNTDTLCIKTISESANLTAQQNIDADIMLPDYYDTIGKILKSEITPVIEAVTSNGDKISIAGIAKFAMIYIGEDKKMYCYENEYRYTKVFQSQFAEKNPAIKPSQTVFSVNCRAIAPKRIELRAVLQIGVRINTESDSMLISSIDNDSIIVKNENITYISSINSVSRSFSLNASYPLNDFNDKIDIIIRKNSRIIITEIKTIHNKAYIKGLAETEILYFSNDTNNTASTVLSIPVSEIIDIFGAEENDECNIYFNDIYTEVGIKNESDNQTLDIRLDVNLQAEINRIMNGSIISDMYSIKNEISFVKDSVVLYNSRKRASKTETAVFETSIYDESIFTIIDTWANNIKISCEKQAIGYGLLITATFNALIRNEDSVLSIISREHTFEATIPTESSECTATNMQANVLSISALQMQGSKIKFSADIIIEADIYTFRKVSGFTNIEINDTESYDNSAKYIIYFAKQNEELWSVAKENRTSVDIIKNINNLTEDIFTEDKMIILPSF